jgi:hypothetical protein
MTESIVGEVVCGETIGGSHESHNDTKKYDCLSKVGPSTKLRVH